MKELETREDYNKEYAFHKGSPRECDMCGMPSLVPICSDECWTDYLEEEEEFLQMELEGSVVTDLVNSVPIFEGQGNTESPVM